MTGQNKTVTGQGNTNGTQGGPARPFLAFISDKTSLEILRQFTQGEGWGVDCVCAGDATVAAEHLKQHPTPEVLLVEMPSAEAAPEMLNRLADVCDPGVKVIVTGKVDEFSFYNWLKDMGVSDYLLQPLTTEAIRASLGRVRQPEALPAQAVVKRQGKLVAVIGSRGGVGATTLSVNVSSILAGAFQQSVVLMDCDPQWGTAALGLDVLPGRGLREALEKPDRIDTLFMDRMLVKYNERLSVLAAEELLDQPLSMKEAAADKLVSEVRSRCDVVIADLPRVLSPFTRQILAQAETVLVVTELHLAGLRDALRLQDAFRDTLKIASPVFVSSRGGLTPKQEMPKAEFEKALGRKIAFSIPFDSACYGAADGGKVLAETAARTAIVRAFTEVAASLIDTEEELPDNPGGAGGRLLSMFRKGS